MRNKLLILLVLLVLPLRLAHAQGTVPSFRLTVGQASYAVGGAGPAAGTTTIPTLLVPVTLLFEAKQIAGKPFVMDAAPDVAAVLRSPIFSNFAFPTGGNTQYADAMLRTTFASGEDWHTLLSKPQIKPIRITIPAGYGYILTSKASRRSLAVVEAIYQAARTRQRVLLG